MDCKFASFWSKTWSWVDSAAEKDCIVAVFDDEVKWRHALREVP